MKVIIFLCAFFALSFCVPLSNLPELRGRDLFLALSFHQYRYQNTLYGYDNEIILYKEKAKISLVGNMVNEVEKDVERAVNFLSPYFELSVVKGYTSEADIYLNIYSSDKNTINDAIIERENTTNKIIFNRIGATRTFTESGSQIITDKFVEIPDGFRYSSSGHRMTICNSVPVFEDINKQINTNWKVTLPFIPVKINEIPDFYIDNIFMGFNNISYPQDYPSEDFSVHNLRSAVFPCILEELIHSLTFWRDVQDGTDRYFFSRRAHEGSVSEVAQGYESDLENLRKILSFYNLEGMRPGLTIHQVNNILIENGF